MSGLNAGAAEWRPGAPSAQLGGGSSAAASTPSLAPPTKDEEETTKPADESPSTTSSAAPPAGFNLGAKPFVPGAPLTGSVGTPTSTPQTFSAYTGRTEPPRVLNAAQQRYQQGNQQARQQYPGGDQQQGQQQYGGGPRQQQQQQQQGGGYQQQSGGNYNQSGYQGQQGQGAYGGGAYGQRQNPQSQQGQGYTSGGFNQQQQGGAYSSGPQQNQSQQQGYGQQQQQQGNFPQQQQQQQQQRQMQPPQMRQMRPPGGNAQQPQQQNFSPAQQQQQGYASQQQQQQQQYNQQQPPYSPTQPQHYSQNPYQQQVTSHPQTQTPPPQQMGGTSSAVREMKPPMRQMKPPGGSATSTPTAPGPAGSLSKPTSGAVPLTNRAADSVPPVILVIGVRGSGKSTQAKRIAENFNFLHLSSGDIARQGKDPLAELDAALSNWLTPDGNPMDSQFRGLVLDRYVAISHFDVYYLGHILQKYSLRINLVINLNLDPELGNDRAKARDEGRDAPAASATAGGDLKSRPQRDQRRLVEQNLLSETSRLLFQASGALQQVVVTERSIEAVAAECSQLVHQAVNEHPRKAVNLSRCTLEDGSPLVTDFSLFKEVRNGLHEVLGTPKMKWEAFPGSQMTGQMTQNEWKKWEHTLRDYYVTLKADGKRVLLVRWEDRIFIMPAKFVCMYELPSKYIPSVLLTGTTRDEAKDGKVPSDGPGSKLHFILDCEFVQQRSNKKYCYYIFDYIFYEGKKAAKVYFADRYKLLKDLMDQNTAYSCIFVKEFVDLRDVKKILPGKFHDDSLPFEIDGLILQHNGPYKVPQDNKVYKWKPRELCSVDFRLCGMSVLPPSEEDIDCTYRFELATLAMVDGVKDERPYLGGKAVLLATEAQVQQYSLANGTVVEAVKAKWNKGGKDDNPQQAIQEWRFMRVRTDKAFPNAEEIAVSIDNMKPWNLDDLRKACAQLQPPRR